VRSFDLEDLPVEGTPDDLATPVTPWVDQGRQAAYGGQLDRCQDFRSVFNLVKRSVKEALNRERTGLLLYLRDLPLQVGAYHQLGTNAIILNRVLLEQVVQTTVSRAEVNAFLYYILLHEYLHTLGFVDERRVRALTAEITTATFGPRHVATRMATEGPWARIKLHPYAAPRVYERAVEIVRDFEDPPFTYIV